MCPLTVCPPCPINKSGAHFLGESLDDVRQWRSMTPGSPRPRRTHAQARAEMREGILRLGREQLETRGAAALSVREIARGLGVASSAVYRHVSSREELLTLLVADTYTDLADRVDAALADIADSSGNTGNTTPPLPTMAHAVRGWAVANPTRWALIYGTPVPGYAAPADTTTMPGTRVMGVFLGIVAGGAGSGTPQDDSPSPSPELTQVLAEGTEELGVVASPRASADAVLAWSSLIGLISAEIFGQLGPELAALGGELLDRWIADTTRRFGLG
ncbi:TetR DNA-binding transcription regulator [Corynebacterium variabile DSM 44702]|uniref:TetR DNA-binding transcription regulator n=2 Tax=Corynebacterium variabile TaxID=1727 RepID=G0HGW6_CORVD|nr:TetR DNA-binding transcription regulator [Corynebacterium variabile DSM 44702]